MKLLLLLPLFVVVPLANADYTHIGIEWSQSCQTLNTIHNDKCSSPDFVNLLYQDTKLKPSYQKAYDDAQADQKTKIHTNGVLIKHKLSCISKNYCDAFTNSTVYYWFNPDKSSRPYLDHIITLTPNMLDRNIYQTNKTNPIIDNGTSRAITFNTHDLFIDSCATAILKPGVIWKDLGRVIHYMVNGCQNPELLGNLKDNYVEPISKHILDITTSPNWNYTQKLKADIERCKIKC